jgi:hypothetical protein
MILLLVLLFAELGNSLVRVKVKGFGAAEGRTTDLHDAPAASRLMMGGVEGEMPTCSFKYLPLPGRLDTALPQLVDIFAEQTAEKVYFVGLNQNQCLNLPELSGGWDPARGYPSQFYGKTYQCLFSASVAGTVLASVKSDQVCSDGDSMVFHCPIPEALRKLASNTADRAKLVVTVRHVEPVGAETAKHRPTDAWENLPVCANPIVNKQEVLSPAKEHYLSACLYATGDPYWAIQNQWVIGSVERR